MEIRALRETDDRLAVSRIYEESWKSAYKGIIPQPYLDGIPVGRWAVGRLDREGWQSLLLLEAEDPIGTVCICPSRWADWPGFGEIVSLYLLPDHMGKGYGKLLLSAAVRELERRGFRDILLWVLEENLRARRFYEENGFCPNGASMEHTIGGKALRELLYCRSEK